MGQIGTTAPSAGMRSTMSARCDTASGSCFTLSGTTGLPSTLTKLPSLIDGEVGGRGGVDDPQAHLAIPLHIDDLGIIERPFVGEKGLMRNI
jgi:hypothetical protein